MRQEENAISRDSRILEVADAIGLDYDITHPFLEKQRQELEGLIAKEVGELVRNMYRNDVAIENIAYVLGLNVQMVDEIIKRK